MLILLVASVSADPVVKTALGSIRGRSLGGVNEYRGIPFAQPPVKDLRLKAPLPVQPWEEELDAIRQVSCIQPPGPAGDLEFLSVTGEQSEDCLVLDVYSPSTCDGDCEVYAWIYGGGYHTGSINQKYFDGKNVASSGVLVVEMNYRLNFLGMLASDLEEGSTGSLNFILDQQLALQWIQDHIHHFGGDPKKVTLFGESAGGTSVCIHMAAESSKGLFRNAIVESGACNGPWGPGTLEEGLETSRQWMERNSLTMDQLLTADAAELVAIDTNSIHPFVDGQVLTTMCTETFEGGSWSLPEGGKLLVGGNSLDGLIAPPFSIRPAPEDFKAFIAELMEYNFTEEEANDVAKFYSADSDPANAFYLSTSDVCINCPSMDLADYAGAAGFQSSVYYYDYGRAIHGAEIPMVFGNPTDGLDYDAQLSQNMMKYWFTLENLPNWSDKQALIIDSAGIRPGAHPVYERCQIWKQFDKQKPFDYCNGHKPSGPSTIMV